MQEERTISTPSLDYPSEYKSLDPLGRRRNYSRLWVLSILLWENEDSRRETSLDDWRPRKCRILYEFVWKSSLCLEPSSRFFHTRMAGSTSEVTEPTASGSGIDLHPFLGFTPTSKGLSNYLTSLLPTPPSSSTTTTPSPQSIPTPESKVFSDSIYLNHHSLGLSLVFAPDKGYQPKTGTPYDSVKKSRIRSASIDVYNHEAQIMEPITRKTTAASRPPTSSALKVAFEAFPRYPILVTYPLVDAPEEFKVFSISPETTGKEFSSTLGEPDRKGGGEGSMGIWCEWTGVGLMVEFASGGLQAWEKGADARWKVITVFQRGVMLGKEDGEE